MIIMIASRRKRRKPWNGAGSFSCYRLGQQQDSNHLSVTKTKAPIGLLDLQRLLDGMSRLLINTFLQAKQRSSERCPCPFVRCSSASFRNRLRA